MNPEPYIQLTVTLLTAVITLVYLWKTRVIGANKELLAKYKDDYQEIKEKYEVMKKNYATLDAQFEMMKIRLVKANERLATHEGQPYWANNQSLEADHEPDQTV